MQGEAATLLQEFVESVLGRGELGRVRLLCNHRVTLYLPGALRIYSVLLIEDKLAAFLHALTGVTVEIEEIWNADPYLIYPEDSGIGGAAALISFAGEDTRGTGVVTVRTAKGRIQSIRIETNFSAKEIFEQNRTIPVSRIEVSPVSQPNHIRERIYFEEPFLEEFLKMHFAELSGQPLQEPNERYTGALFSIYGNIVFREILGRRIKDGSAAIAIAWYKGMLMPRENEVVSGHITTEALTVSGITYVTMEGRQLKKDIRLYDY